MVKSLMALVLSCISLVVAAQGSELEALRQDGQWKQIRMRVEGWYQTSPGDPFALLWISRVKQAFGDPAGALALARAAVAKRPDVAELQAQLASAAHVNLAVIEGHWEQMTLVREMKQAGEAALAIQPDHRDAARLMVAFYMQVPAILGGGKTKALALSQKLAGVQPSLGLLLQADIAGYQKEWAEARRLARGALSKDPMAIDILLKLGGIDLAAEPKGFDEALEMYQRVLAAHPRHITAHAQVAAIFAAQQNWNRLDEALMTSRRALSGNQLPGYRAAEAILLHGQSLARAEGLFKAYLNEAPEGDAPDHATAHWRLGQVKEKLGKRAEAQAEFNEALKARPTFREAKADLQRLGQ